MASTQDKYKKLGGNGQDSTQYETDQNSFQLIYPIDFGSGSLGEHPGLAVVFELNKLTDAKTRSYETTLKQTGSSLKTYTNSGLENTEVAMQRDAGATSMRTNMKGSSGGYVKTELSVVLPPPDQWQDNLIANWQAVDMASIGAAGDLVNSVKDVELNAAGKQVVASLPKMLGGAVQAAGGPSIRSFSELLTGNKQNSYTEILFGGVNNRFFPFVWTFTPRSRKEAEVINAIIHRFRWAMLPEMMFEEKNGSFYRAPWTFDIHFVDLSTGRESKWWPRIGTCALTNINVNRTPQGEFAVLGDDEDSQVPAAITVEMQFTELFVLDKSNLDNRDESY